VIVANDIAKRFMWKDRENGFHFPSSMETRHLFYTLRMIWNHTMPADARITPYQAYSFGPFYTRQYLITAIAELARELASRADLRSDLKPQLQAMLDWLSRHQIEAEGNQPLLANGGRS
jgi:hypothetical protein